MSRYNFQRRHGSKDRKTEYSKDNKREYKYHNTQERKERGPEYLIQISGPGRHVAGIPRDIAKQCFQSQGLRDSNGQIQLILGVKANGATEFLAPANIPGIQTWNGTRPYYVLDPNFPFESLSPVTLAHEARLEELVSLHMPVKKGKPSKANKGYHLGGTRLTNELHPRSVYEQVRLLMSCVTETTSFMLNSYGLDPSSDRFGKFLLITCNHYKIGTEEGFRDAAWGTMDLTSLRTVTDVERSRPVLRQDLDFQNDIVDSRKRVACKNQETLLVNEMEDERIALRGYLQGHYANTSDGPLVVLVYNWNRAKKLFTELGIDTSSWKGDLSELIRGRQTTKGNHEESNLKRRSSRSRSPVSRRFSRDELGIMKEEEGGSTSREARPSEYRNNDIYVIDTRTLYSTVRKSGNLKDDLVAVSVDFDIAETEGMFVHEICAGNELPLLWILFTKMAVGPWCDEMWRTQFKSKQAWYSSDEEDEEAEAAPSAPYNQVDTKGKPKEKDPFGLDSDDDNRLLSD
ncbi:hypothetical protein FRC14_001167 [Serendipita sp. 396]|nr:hypothetical protein FRC14_001167 [Serendipita sp. 396]KAG8786163.1 hypothetical protein FRC15_011993 [Serendipita sp. 397]KAG8871942.1 hypothetical protein FRC20_009972 [Serendipita sp. 405]KAG9052748.1 hypothetical protein FS842_009298 [Serendipita sp. 407]